MNENINSDEKHLIQEFKRLEEDPKYRYETDPACFFVEYLEKELNYKFKEKTDNYPNDPPDFILVTEDNKINLEVTSLIDERIPKRNRFFRKAEKYINKYLSMYLIQPGKYSIYYYPGDSYSKIGPSMKIAIPEYKYKVSKGDLKISIEKGIRSQLEGETEKNKLEIKLHNKKNQVFGKIIINKTSDSEHVEFFIQPQGIFRLDNWESDEFRKELQKIINLKQQKCRKNIDKYEGDWWLLISDIDDEMNTWHLGFDIKELKLISNFFDKIFFLSKSGVDCKFYELPIT